MVANDLFEVAGEAAVEGHLGAAFLEDSVRFGEQARSRRIAGQEAGDDAVVRFDENLIARADACDEPLEVAGRFCAREM